jgi:hypothetical protein
MTKQLLQNAVDGVLGALIELGQRLGCETGDTLKIERTRSVWTITINPPPDEPSQCVGVHYGERGTSHVLDLDRFSGTGTRPWDFVDSLSPEKSNESCCEGSNIERLPAIHAVNGPA